MDTKNGIDRLVKLMAEECVAVRMRLLTRAITKIYNKALRPFGVTISQSNVLAAVAYLGEANQQKICHALQMHKSTLSRDLVRMQNAGWIRSHAGEDGRISVLQITSAGKKMLEKIFPAWEQAQHQARTLLAEKDLAGLDRAVAAIRSKNLTSIV